LERNGEMAGWFQKVNEFLPVCVLLTTFRTAGPPFEDMNSDTEGGNRDGCSGRLDQRSNAAKSHSRACFCFQSRSKERPVPLFSGKEARGEFLPQEAVTNGSIHTRKACVRLHQGLLQMRRLRKSEKRAEFPRMGELGRKKRVMIVDDDPDMREVLYKKLKDKGYVVLTAADAGSALRVLESTPVDVVITDFKMPGASGVELVRHIGENFRDTLTIMITGYASIEGAVQAVKAGAEEYLPKPFTYEQLYAAVEKALKKQEIRKAREPEVVAPQGEFHGLIGVSRPMQEVFKAIKKAAATNATVLITGESGTGKELVARAIHYSSPRASAPFVPVNCSGIPEGLIESELFGFVKGAFTGANETRAGFFQTANGGTIFLDEISSTSLSMQAKLLRVLQDNEVRMVGSSKTKKVDVRILAATNKDLLELVRKGYFREDLYYRLNVIAIDLPPLRERGEDILLMAKHFAQKFASEVGKPVPVFSDRVLEIFRDYPWPGNVRELENLVRRLIVMVDRPVIDVRDLPSHMRFAMIPGSNLFRSLASVEAEYIRNVLSSVNGNKTRAARILGIDRKTLREKLKRYGEGA